MAESEERNESSQDLQETVINIAVEAWRFGRVFERLLLKLDAGEQTRYRNQFRWFAKKVEEALAGADLHLVNIEGQRFDPGAAVTPLNIEDFEPDDVLVVEQMVEPIIMGKACLIRTGTVILKKVEI